MIMKVEDLITKEADVDIFNDYLDEEIPAFVGPQGLTEAGKQRYKEVLNLEVELDPRPEPRWAEIKLGFLTDDDEADRLFEEVSDFFAACAGYISETEYEKYFKED